MNHLQVSGGDGVQICLHAPLHLQAFAHSLRTHGPGVAQTLSSPYTSPVPILSLAYPHAKPRWGKMCGPTLSQPYPNPILTLSSCRTLVGGGEDGNALWMDALCCLAATAFTTDARTMMRSAAQPAFTPWLAPKA